MNSPRDGLARSVQVRLVRHAKAVGADPNLVLTRFAMERFFYRLSLSSHADQFVLKGAKVGDKIGVSWKDNQGNARTDEVIIA